MTVTYLLQRWDRGGKPVIPQVISTPHWSTICVYSEANRHQAVAARKRFSDGDDKYQIVKRTEEVIP